MKELSIDIETYSSVDLITSGVYAYCYAPDFSILLFAYAFGGEEVCVVDIANDEPLPEAIKKALTEETIKKTAYNANFERVCIKTYFQMELPITQWQCSAVWAAELGLPQTLEATAAILGLEQQKDTRGKALIQYFCKPCKATKSNGGRTRNLPHHDKEKWDLFKQYCKQDVNVERAIKTKLSVFPLTERENKLWQTDQIINDRGVLTDVEMIKNAIKYNEVYQQKCKKKLQQLTGLENPNSVSQLKQWIFEKTGVYYESLNKEAVNEIVAGEIQQYVKEVLRLRSDMAKTSTKKYEAAFRSICKDNRIRGLLQFYGANRTGRWAGRIVQVQNLPQNHLKDLNLARDLVKEGDYELFEMVYGKTPHILSELIRTMLISGEGRRFIVSDFSAIEARVLSYLAQEQWRIEVFQTHGKIYEASAAQMFHVPVESITKGNPLRQKGKIAELALGYGGGIGALTSMGALKMGLLEEELPDLVEVWRNANRNIVKYWKTVEKAALNAIDEKPSKIHHGISFQKEKGILFIGLPSGRRIAYVQPRVEKNQYGSDCMTYMGMNSSKKWSRISTFGGKLVENIVQAVARDCLAESILKLEKKGYEINFHVHDEVVINAPMHKGSLKEVTDIMGEEIHWAKGLPLKAEGYETTFYKKD